jgi:HD-GYP domain-containing protein (c-di-GMP phosphodiesterase class II)
MTSGRPYRRALTAQEALEELRRNAGTQFDRGCVEAFEQHLELSEAA